MERRKCYHMLIAIGMMTWMALPAMAQATGNSDTEFPLAFSGSVTPVSKYIWRGQRLTDGWSLQPSGTLSIGNFSANVWGNMDLEAVNEGDALLLKENPAAPPGSNGLRGQLSEIDYTFSYSVDLKKAGLDFGTIFYTFPNRSASLPATTEIYGGVTLSDVPLSPSATLYVDVDETGDSGSTGMYFLLGAGHSFAFGHSRFPGLDLSSTLSFVNNGFGEYYYGASESGAHDFSFSVSLPINLGEHWSAGAFLTYSALLGDFRNYQYLNPRRVYLGTAGSPAASADTVWGGFNFNVEF